MSSDDAATERKLRAFLDAQRAHRPVFLRRPGGAGSTETHQLVARYPVLNLAWPENPRRVGWLEDELVPDWSPEPHPAWLDPGSVCCVGCHFYTCLERCSGKLVTCERQSLAEYLMARTARRPYPRAKAALKSVQDACATCPGVEPLAAALVVALNVYFSRCADVVYADGLEQLSRLLPHPAWEEDNSLMGHELTPKQRKEVSAARLGRALWRMARLELADMVPEEMQLAELYLDALCGGELQPPAPDPPAEALQAYHQLMARLSAGFDSQQDLWRLRTRCGLAPLMAPRPEGPNSFGRVNWDCITNGTDEPTPRDGWFSLFARLPARERADDNERVLQRVLHALAPLNAEMGLKCTKHVPQVLPRGLLMPSLSQNNDYTHAGLDAAGRQLLRLRVSNRWIPAPCATQPQRFGNLVELTWRAPEKRNLERHLRKALQAEFAPDAVSCRQLEELTGWGCSVVPHTRSRIPVDGSEYELEAVSGEAPERAGEDSKRELSTLWSLWRGKEQVAKAVMTYRNVDVTIFGPGFELFAVKKKYREKGIGRLFHSAITAEIARPKVGWMPGDACIGLQAIFVTDYHRWFEKVGYLWAEETEEVQSRQGLSTAQMLQAIQQGRPEDLAATMMSAGGNISGRRNEDGLLPLFRRNECAACAASPCEQTPDVKLKTCSRCRFTQYCSSGCQADAWLLHKARPVSSGFLALTPSPPGGLSPSWPRIQGQVIERRGRLFVSSQRNSSYIAPLDSGLISMSDADAVLLLSFISQAQRRIDCPGE